MDHAAAKLDIRYETNRIILRGEPELIHQEAERIIGQFRFSDCPYRLHSNQTHRIELISCGWS